MKRVLGITGGIASGKTTVMGMFQDLGAEVLSADDVAREVLSPGSPATDEVVARFGSRIVSDEGFIDRSALADIVFRDAEARETLDAITHPRITEVLQERIARFREEDSGSDMLAVEIPLLVECNLAWLVDEVVVVVAEQDQQISRLKTRGLSLLQARQRLAAQAPLCEKTKLANWVVTTDVSLAQTRRQVESIFRSVPGR